MPIISGNTIVNTTVANSTVTVDQTQSWLYATSNRNPIRPNILLDFSRSQTVDPRVVFTRASSATYYNNLGVLSTVGNNVPRIDYNPSTLACNGLLIEQASTNLLLYSATLTNWSTSNITLSSSGTAPDGATSILATENSTTAIHDTAHSGITISASSTYTFSAFVKYAGRQYVIMNFDNSAGNGFGVVFDLINGLATSSGTNGSGVYTSSVIQPLSNGWYRLIITGNLAATDTSARTSIISSPSSTYSWYPSTTGLNASAFYIYGIQLEQSAFVTSYIPTTSSTATRANELAYLPVGSWYNPVASTILVTALKATSADPGYGGVVSLNDNSSNNRVAFSVAPSTTTLSWSDSYTSNILDVQLNLGSYTVSIPYKAAGSITGALSTSGNIAASLNGAPAVTGVTNNFPGSALTQLQLGTPGGVGNFMNGWIQLAAYYPIALSNIQLQTMTS